MMFRVPLAALTAIALGLLASCGPKAATKPNPADVALPASHVGGHPALWKTGDADTTIYLFGTVHVLPQGLRWRTAGFDKAFGEARAVYFETDIDSDFSVYQSLVQTIGFYPEGQTLTQHLGPERTKTVAQAASRLEISMRQLDEMRPWMAATVLGQALVLKAGYDPDSGAERLLLPMAHDAKKEVRKLETVQEQLMAFADLPQDVQIAYLMDGVGNVDGEAGLLADLVKAWSSGDVATLEKRMIEEDMAKSPDVYRSLLVNRNHNWTEELDRLVKTEPGVFFVAVGAGHLAGKDSVRAMLEAKGYKVEQVE